MDTTTEEVIELEAVDCDCCDCGPEGCPEGCC